MFGDALRELRKQRKMSQEELGKKIGATKQSISRYESGRVPDVETIMALAEALEVPFSTLIQDYDWNSAVIMEDETDRDFLMGTKTQKPITMPANKAELHRIIDRLSPDQTDILLTMVQGLVKKQ